MTRFLQPKAVDILEAAGAQRTWHSRDRRRGLSARTCSGPVAWATIRPPRSWIAGTAATTSTICLSAMARVIVTSGRGQPTLTIQALAFRAADYMHRAARQNAIASAW
jgi:hypothetical protein